MIGDRLTKLRKQKGYEAQYVANLLNVAKSTYSGYENNKSVPNHESLKKIADFYSVSVDYILGRTNDTTPIGHSKKEKEVNEKLDDFIKEVEKSDGLMFSGSKMDESTKEVLLKMLRTTKDMAEKMNENNKK